MRCDASRRTVSEVLPELPLPGERHHDLRQAERERVAAVHLPEVDGLAVGPAHLLQVPALHGAGHARHEQHPALHLELVRVPQRLLLVGQRQEHALGDDVLDADEARAGAGAVEDEALADVLVEVRAEVVRLHLPPHVVRVEVERAQVLVDLPQRREPLDRARRRLQQRRPRLRRLAGDLHVVARRRHGSSLSLSFCSCFCACNPGLHETGRCRVELLLKGSELGSCSGTRVTLEEIRVCGDPSGAPVGVETWPWSRVVGTAALPRWTRTHDGAQIVHGLHVGGSSPVTSLSSAS
jgi:hypothetical protein